MKTITAGELIKKLEAINDKDVEVYFYCPSCDGYVPVADMNGFGFQYPAKEVQ